MFCDVFDIPFAIPTNFWMFTLEDLSKLKSERHIVIKLDNILLAVFTKQINISFSSAQKHVDMQSSSRACRIDSLCENDQ